MRIVTDDRELIRRSLRRDRTAFAELLDRHGKVLLRYAYSLTRDADDAEDIVQESYVTAWRKLAEIRLVGDSVLPWLMVTCRNHAANLRRSQAIRATVPLDAEAPDPAPTPLSRLERLEEFEAIASAVAELTPTDRRIIELCLYEGHAYEQAAAELGLSVGVLTKRVHRARTRLREQRTLREGEASA